MEIEAVLDRKHEMISNEGSVVSHSQEQDIRQRIDQYRPGYLDEVERVIDMQFKEHRYRHQLVGLAKVLGLAREEFELRVREENLDRENPNVRDEWINRVTQFQDEYFDLVNDRSFEGWLEDPIDQLRPPEPGAYVRSLIEQFGKFDSK